MDGVIWLSQSRPMIISAAAAITRFFGPSFFTNGGKVHREEKTPSVSGTTAKPASTGVYPSEFCAYTIRK